MSNLSTIDNCINPWTGIYPNVYHTPIINIPAAPPWVAYNDDLHDVIAFADELTALRYAVEHGMRVKQLQWGTDISKQLWSGN